MVIALSRFRVANGRENDVRDAFLNRPGLVDTVPGFLGLEVFTDSSDASLFYLLTRWTDAESFQSWHSGPDHSRAHIGIPKGLKLDASFTELRTLDRISSSNDSMHADAARDAASLISNFLKVSDSVYWIKFRPNGVVLACNRAFATRSGPETCAGLPIWQFLTDTDAANIRVAIEDGRQHRYQKCQLNFVDHEHLPFTLLCYLDVQPDWVVLVGEAVQEDEVRLQRELMELNNRLAVELRESDRKSKALRQAQDKLEQAFRELRESRRHLEAIGEVLPICLVCGKVKTNELGWEALVEYFQRNNLALSHGYCPACYKTEMEKLDL